MNRISFCAGLTLAGALLFGLSAAPAEAQDRTGREIVDRRHDGRSAAIGPGPAANRLRPACRSPQNARDRRSEVW